MISDLSTRIGLRCQRLSLCHRGPPWAIPLAVTAMAILPGHAWAHIKWFEPYDITAAPKPVTQVLSVHFMLTFLGFVVLIFAGFLLDRFLVRQKRLPLSPASGQVVAENLVRAGTAGFFIALFATGGVILTPELHTSADWPAWLQFGIAISMLSRGTCILGGLGILSLYAYGINQYGVFHLSDYPMFPGLAIYLGLTSFTSERLRAWRMSVLTMCICMGLMWGAAEKWAYPQWTIPLLQARPYLTLGVPPSDVMIIAGFVEFSLAFYILIGLTLVPVAIVGLVLLFSGAVLDFGKIDAIGHLPIVVPLIAMLFHGPNQVQTWFYEASAGLMAEARKASIAFASAVCFLFAVYYATQSAEYGQRVPSLSSTIASNTSVRAGSAGNITARP
jgi:hypothetical protein